MNQEKMTKQMGSLYRTMFDSSLNALATVHDYTEKVVFSSLEKSPWIPEEGRVLAHAWLNVYKKGYDDFRTKAVEAYKRYETAFEPAKEAETVEKSEKLKTKKA
jgi:hypothetical protein